MALGLGGLPDIIHPSHKQKLATGEHALGGNPAFSDPSKHEKHAGQTYQQVMRNAERYYGQMPRSQRDAVMMAVEVMQALGRIQQTEAEHRPELEHLAVETVLRMDEFKSLRRALEQGNLKIDAKLQPQLEIQGTAFSDEPQEEPEEMEIPQIRQEIDQAIHKRNFVNALIQGAALTNNYAWSYHSRDELSQIDPDLLRDYGKLMSATEVGYWVQGEEAVRQAMQAGGEQAQVGDARLKSNPDGSVTVQARGVAFPILVQELIKGLMEYLSFDDEEDPETRKLVHSKSDFIDAETIQMMLGPSLWKEFLDAVGGDAREVVPHVYDHIVRMPTTEFNQLMRGLVDGDPAAKRQMHDLAQQIKREVGGQEEALRIAKRLLGG